MVKASPMGRQIRAFEQVYLDSGAVAVQHHAGKAHRRAPAIFQQAPIHGAFRPRANQAIQLMVVRATRCKGAIGGQTVLDVRLGVFPSLLPRSTPNDTAPPAAFLDGTDFVQSAWEVSNRAAEIALIAITLSHPDRCKVDRG